MNQIMNYNMMKGQAQPQTAKTSFDCNLNHNINAMANKVNVKPDKTF